MYLLIFRVTIDENYTDTDFTFHYVSINIKFLKVTTQKTRDFTFHYVSINMHNQILRLHH